ncbi:MAG: glmZ(sRNA)-inactivating NTPase [Peptococcaceae bacterium BRH_c4b]|nr:MAG: glmZ(sRNA)-inactivating NTPase [Peptococcaceae bacterium BRH_c4b]
MAVQSFIIVTGLSGAGKTQAVRSLEDMGYFCVDNIPPALIPKFAELCYQSKSDINKVALVVDIRGGEFFDSLSEVLSELDRMGTRYHILFLEASEETLIRRFKESRRSHPLSHDGEVLQWVREERTILEELRGSAHKIIDTSDMSPTQLKEEINNLYGDSADTSRLRITVVSFGYKYGIPMDSDLIFDVRFLPNPHYDPALRPLTGNHPEVQNFVLSTPNAVSFLDKLFDITEFLLPQYVKEGKNTLMIAIGCTGGMHRSVTVANKLTEHLKSKNYRAKVRHRDTGRITGSGE